MSALLLNVPWRVTPCIHRPGAWIIDGDGNTRAFIPDEARAEAIVRACNSHKAVLDALAAHTDWEADLIIQTDWSVELPRLTRPLIEKLIRVQAQRNAALAIAIDGGRHG